MLAVVRAVRDESINEADTTTKIWRRPSVGVDMVCMVWIGCVDVAGVVHPSSR